MHKVLYYYLMARYRVWRHYPRGAVYYYRKLVTAYPNSSSLQSELIHALYEDKQYELAIEYCRELLLKRPESIDYTLITIRSLIMLESYDEALEVCNSAIDTHPENYQLISSRADIYLTVSQFELAYSDYERAVTLATTNRQKSYCYHSLGYISMQTKKDNADEMFRRAVDASDSAKAKQLGIGVLHYDRGWYHLAQHAFEDRVVDEAENAHIYFELGRVYEKLLLTNKAAEAYRNYVKCDKQRIREKHKLNHKLVIFDAYMARNYACSPRAIYEEMLHNPAYKDHRFIWVFRGSSLTKHWRLYLNPRTKIVRYMSEEYFRSYSRAKYWVTNSRIAYVLKTHEEQVYVQCWHGTPLKRIGHSVRGLDGSGLKHDKAQIAELYDHETKRFDYLLSPSKKTSEYFMDAFALKQFGKENIILETGYPRNDYLAKHTQKDVEKVKKRLGIPTDKKVLLYAPTWRDDQHTDGKGYTYNAQTDFDYLKSNLSGEWTILFRAHYFIANGFNFEKYKGFVMDVSGVDDINDLYIVSDVLMTDYSSVFFDYANLRRPIIFFMYDLEHYMKELRGFYLDLDEVPGDIIKSENEIVHILNDLGTYAYKHKEKYQKFHDTYNYLDDGEAAKRALDALIR